MGEGTALLRDNIQSVSLRAGEGALVLLYLSLSPGTTEGWEKGDYNQPAAHPPHRPGHRSRVHLSQHE